MEIELPKAGFSITLSLSCPYTGLPVDRELLNKAVSCQGCPKSGHPVPSVHSHAKCRKCMWEVPGELGSLPRLLVSSPLKALLLTDTFRVQNVKQGKTIFFSVREPYDLHLQISMRGKELTSQKKSGRSALGLHIFMVLQHLQSQHGSFYKGIYINLNTSETGVPGQVLNTLQ